MIPVRDMLCNHSRKGCAEVFEPVSGISVVAVGNLAKEMHGITYAWKVEYLKK